MITFLGVIGGVVFGAIIGAIGALHWLTKDMFR